MTDTLERPVRYMNDRDAFIAAIHARPDDGVPPAVFADCLEEQGGHADEETLHALRSGEPVTLLAGRSKVAARPAKTHPTAYAVALSALRSGAAPDDLYDGSPPVVGPVRDTTSRMAVHHGHPVVSAAMSALNSLYHGVGVAAMGDNHGDTHLIHAGYNDTPEQQVSRWSDTATRWLTGNDRHDFTAAKLHDRDRRHAALRLAGGVLTILAGRDHAEPHVRQAEAAVAERDAADDRAEALRAARQKADEGAKAHHATVHRSVMGDEIAYHEAESKKAYTERRVGDGHRHKTLAAALSQPGYVRVERPSTMRGEPPAGVIWHKPATSGKWGKPAQTKHGRPLTTEELEALAKED